MPAARTSSPTLLRSGVPGEGEEGYCVLTLKAVCLGLRAEKGKERGPASDTSRLHVSLVALLDGLFFFSFF